MNVGEWATVIGASGSVLGGGGWFVARATVRAAQVTANAQEAIGRANEAAARAAAAPAQQEASLAILQASVKRVDEENGSLRGRVYRLEVLVRAFSSYVGQLTGQMRANGMEPPAPPDAVDEYNRTGV